MRAAFGYPCIPYEYVYSDGEPFYSGTQWVNTVSDTTTYEITVNDIEPIFYYCGAPNSCIGEGMIGVINPNSSQTLKDQKDARDIFPLDLVPGDEWPSENNPMHTVSGLAVTETATSATSTSTAGHHGVDTNSTPTHSLTTGQIAGISIGGAAIIIILAVLIYFLGRRGGMEKGYRKSVSFFGGNKTEQNLDIGYSAGSPMAKNTASVQTNGFGLSTPSPPSMSPDIHSQYSDYHSPITQQYPYQYVSLAQHRDGATSANDMLIMLTTANRQMTVHSVENSATMPVELPASGGKHPTHGSFP